MLEEGKREVGGEKGKLFSSKKVMLVGGEKVYRVLIVYFTRRTL